MSNKWRRAKNRMGNSQSNSKENLLSPEEYSAIRAEIISASEIKHNYIIAMNAAVLTLIGLGLQLQNRYLFLLPYIVLFSFQKRITAQNNNMVRLSAFLVVFSNDKWEKGLYERSKFTKEKEYSKLRNSRIMRINSCQLGLISTLIYMVSTLFNMYSKGLLRSGMDLKIQITGFVSIIVAWLLFFLLHLWCMNALNALADRQYYIEKNSILLVNDN